MNNFKCNHLMPIHYKGLPWRQEQESLRGGKPIASSASPIDLSSVISSLLTTIKPQPPITR